jgi:hypothetical protein
MRSTMRKYDVYPVNVNNDFMWEVYEMESEHIVERFFFEEDAVRTAKFMENGGAFSGWTPAFLLRPVDAPRNINLEFNDLVIDW